MENCKQQSEIKKRHLSSNKAETEMRHLPLITMYGYVGGRPIEMRHLPAISIYG